VNIDGLSILYPFRDAVAFGIEHSTLDSVVARAAAGMGVALGADPFPQEAFFVRSDQYSFVRQGIPSAFLFMGFKGDSGLDAPARFRQWMAARYHTPQDDLSQPMDLEAGARHATLAWRVGVEIANAETRPAWKGDSFLGRMFGRRNE
jgi:Zn-dependent M28 family amino/carboxypeptidase